MNTTLKVGIPFFIDENNNLIGFISDTDIIKSNTNPENENFTLTEDLNEIKNNLNILFNNFSSIDCGNSSTIF